jgi:hypothetical protein
MALPYIQSARGVFEMPFYIPRHLGFVSDGTRIDDLTLVKMVDPLSSSMISSNNGIGYRFLTV